MITLFSVVVIGFVLGMRHATDADHVIAVSAIVSRERSISSAVRIGALWGIGHSLTIGVVGSAIILFDVVIPPRVGLSMEFSVAVMLILLGVFNLRGLRKSMADASQPTLHSVFHTHERADAVQWHSHVVESAAHQHTTEQPIDGVLSTRRLGFLNTVRPLVVGVIHGLAGSAAIALLVLTTIPSPLWGLAYLFVFGLGTVAGMMLITLANGVPFTLTAGRFTRVNRYLGLATAALSVGLGLFLAYQVGVLQGLFSSHPTWTPG